LLESPSSRANSYTRILRANCLLSPSFLRCSYGTADEQFAVAGHFKWPSHSIICTSSSSLVPLHADTIGFAVTKPLACLWADIAS
jgi:hypothetical protein